MNDSIEAYYTFIRSMPEPYGSPADLIPYKYLVPVGTTIPEGTSVVVYEDSEDAPAWSLPFNSMEITVGEREHGVFWTDTPLS